MPSDGVQKGPGRRVSPRLKAVGESVGIRFTGATDRYPNSLLAHVAMDYALRLEEQGNVPRGTQNALMEALFAGYFTHGVYPDASNIGDMADAVGIDKSGMLKELKQCRHASGTAERVQREAKNASNMGVSGVPFFIINGAKAFSGAQDPQVIIDAFDAFSE